MKPLAIRLRSRGGFASATERPIAYCYQPILASRFLLGNYAQEAAPH